MSMHAIQTADGVTLNGELLESDRPKALVLINPAAGTKSSYYRPFALFLKDQGFSVFLFDYRGVGRSKLGPLQRLSYRFQDYGLLDVPAVIEFLTAKFPALPLYVIGHSVGGQQIGIVPNNSKISGVLAVAVSTGFRPQMPLGYRLQANFFFRLFAPVSVLFTGYVAAKRFKIMEDLPAGVVQQWKQWSADQKYLFASLGKSLPRGNYHELPFPVSVVSASDDEIATEANVRDFWAEVRSKERLNFLTLTPENWGLKSIGHLGYFKKHKTMDLWNRLLQEIDSLVSSRR